MLVIPCFILYNCLIFICLMVAKLKCSQYLIFICFIKQAITAACSASCLNLIISHKKTLRFYVKIAKVQSQFIICFIFFDECSKHSVSSTVKNYATNNFASKVCWSSLISLSPNCWSLEKNSLLSTSPWGLMPLAQRAFLFCVKVYFLTFKITVT